MPPKGTKGVVEAKEVGSEQSEYLAFRVFMQRFVDSVENVRSCARFFVPLAAELEVQALKKLQGDLNDSVDKLKGGQRTVANQALLQMPKLIQRVRRANAVSQTALLANSLFVSLFSAIDTFMGDLLAAAYSLRPELLDGAERTYALKDILRYESISGLRESAVQREIESFRRDSYVDQFKALEAKFGFKTLREYGNWPVFVEATQRRNLITHCDGVVSEQYLLVCEREGYQFKQRPSVGVKLKIDPKYLGGAIEAVHETGIKLAQTVWRKLFPQVSTNLDDHLNAEVFDLLLRERWRLAQVFGEFGVRQRKHSSDAVRRMLIVNYAQALLWGGRREDAIKVVEAEDWSSCVPDFKLCVAVILGDKAGAVKLMREIGKRGAYVSKSAYYEWPVFRELRAVPEFLSAYKRIYREDFLAAASKALAKAAGGSGGANAQPQAPSDTEP